MGILTNPILTEQTVVAVKSEAVYGVSPAISAADCVYVSKFEPKIDHKEVGREYLHGSMLQVPDAPGSTLVQVSIEGEYQSANAPGAVASFIDALELAAGKNKSINAGVNVVYAPSSTTTGSMPGPGTSCTIAGYYRGELITARGVYGNYVETLKSDGIITFKFDGKGLYTAMSHTTPLAPTYPDNYIHVASGSIIVHSYDAEISEMSVDYGVTVDADPYIGDQYGFSRTRISKQVPMVKIDPLMDSVATFDPISKLVQKTSGSVVATFGTVAGSKVQYTFGNTQLKDVTPGDRNGVEKWDITLNVNGSWTKVIF